MSPAGNSNKCPAARYLDHEGSSLAVNAYRNWLMGLVERDEARFRDVYESHSKALGVGLSRLAMEGMHALVSELEVCSRCPLRFLKPSSGHLCRDEGLVLGIIAGIHNGDEVSVWRCASNLACPKMADLLVGAIGQYAMPLKAGGKTLMPFPNEILIALERDGDVCPESQTLH